MNSVKEYAAYIGLDVHKDTIAVAIAHPERQGEVRFWGNIDSDLNSVRRLFNSALASNKSIHSCLLRFAMLMPRTNKVGTVWQDYW